MVPAVAAVILVAVVYAASGPVLAALAGLAYSKDQPALGNTLASVMRFHPSPEVRLQARELILGAICSAASIDTAVQSLLDHTDAAGARGVDDRRIVNNLVDRSVTHGRYEEAVRVADAGSPPTAPPQGGINAHYAWLVRINRAEALHNLGRDDEALEDLERVVLESRADEYVKAGALSLKAWILASRGDPLAMDVIASVAPSAVGRPYMAEVHYTRAAALGAADRFEDALAEAQLGLECAVRAPSERNGWFLLGTLCCDAGDLAEGLEHFEQGLTLEYQGQGGPALLRRAHALRDLERSGVREALQLAIERDPQCTAAGEARRELQALGAPE